MFSNILARRGRAAIRVDHLTAAIYSRGTPVRWSQLLFATLNRLTRTYEQAATGRLRT